MGFASRLNELLDGYQICLAVIGLPLDLQGRERESAALARELGSMLQSQLGWDVVYLDERFSSRRAEDDLHRAGKSAKKRKKEVDASAAAHILQDWLDYRLADYKEPDG